MHRRIIERTPLADDQLPTDLHPVLRRVYLNRGVGQAKELDLSLQQLHRPQMLKGINEAVDLLLPAIESNQRILIIGDYDADGATSAALAVLALRRMGAKQVDYLVPDRFRYGYGLTPEIVALALDGRPDLIITVDNGISSLEGVKAAKRAGIQVLITDHHLPGASLPEADAIVNPNQPDCGFPSKHLAGVGVVFYLMAALRSRLRELGQTGGDCRLAGWLDLVALGTVADVVRLDHNNRVLVEQGLKRIRSGQGRPGIRALAQVAGRDIAGLTASDLGFALGPRLNAAGRLQDMSIGIECLLAEDLPKAMSLASELDDINQARREIQAQMQSEALAITDTVLSELGEVPNGLCVYSPEWHEGVVGLIASRLKERHHRPCIAFASSAQPGVLKGSARSIPGLHIRDTLDEIATRHPGLLEKFGGHAMAAGLSLDLNALDAFRSAFIDIVGEKLGSDQLEARIETEGSLEASDLTLGTAELLRESGPWGQGFSEPLFHGQFHIQEARLLQDRHVKMRLATGDDVNHPAVETIEAIAFNYLEDNRLPPSGDIQIVYRLDVNDFRGQRRPQLIIEHLIASTTADK